MSGSGCESSKLTYASIRQRPSLFFFSARRGCRILYPPLGVIHLPLLTRLIVGPVVSIFLGGEIVFLSCNSCYCPAYPLLIWKTS